MFVISTVGHYGKVYWNGKHWVSDITLAETYSSIDLADKECVDKLLPHYTIIEEVWEG